MLVPHTMLHQHRQMSSTHSRRLDAGPGFSVSDTGDSYSVSIQGLWDESSESGSGSNSARKRARNDDLDVAIHDSHVASQSRKRSCGAVASTFMGGPHRMLSHTDAAACYASATPGRRAVVPAVAVTHSSLDHGAPADCHLTPTEHATINAVPEPGQAPTAHYDSEYADHCLGGASCVGRVFQGSETEAGPMQINAEHSVEVAPRPAESLLLSHVMQLRSAGGLYPTWRSWPLCDAPNHPAAPLGFRDRQSDGHWHRDADIVERYWRRLHPQPPLYGRPDLGCTNMPAGLPPTFQQHGARSHAHGYAYADGCPGHTPAWWPADIMVPRASIHEHTRPVHLPEWPGEESPDEHSLRSMRTSASMRMLPPSSVIAGNLHAQDSTEAAQALANQGAKLLPVSAPQVPYLQPSVENPSLIDTGAHSAAPARATSIHDIGAAIPATFARPKAGEPARTARQATPYPAYHTYLALSDAFLAKARAAPSIPAALLALPAPMRAVFVGGLLGLLSKHAHLLAASEFEKDAAVVFGSPLSFLHASTASSAASHDRPDLVTAGCDVADGGVVSDVDPAGYA